MPCGALDSKSFAVGVKRYALAVVEVGKALGKT